MSTIGTTLFSKIEINGQEVDIATLDANDGIYALPAGQTIANVKFTMIDNTSIPRGVFEENSYITAMTLPDAITYIASYSFHGVNNINTTDRNAILAINPYAFDAEPTPVVKQNIPTTAVEPIVLSSNKGGTTQNKNVLKIAEYNPSANYLDTSYWVISSSNPNFVVQGVSITPSSNMEYYKVNCEFSVPQATSMSQKTDLTIDFRGNDDYNPGTWTQYVTLEAETSQKQYPTGGWYENSSQVWDLQLVEGSIDAHDLTFDGTPGDSWTFSYMSLPTGITLDSSTGEITVQSGALATAGEYYINANRMEDASYYSGMTTLTIKVFPAGTDLNFHFDQQSVNLDNQAMTTQTPKLTNNTSIDTTLYPIQYVSGDTNVATVDAYGTISFVGAGNTTVTATLSDGNETHTATITVYCTVMSA